MLSFCLRYVSVRRYAFSLLTFFVLGFALGCSSGSSSSTTPAPANLVYPQTTVTVAVGQAISTNTPSVTGTVTSYSISPALPAGLTLNTSTGAISGTPTAAIPSTTFTITASNATGSTTTTVQIVVNVPAPTGLSYPLTTVTATVGQAIAPDNPTVTGAVASYAVAPALPAGLSLNATTGAISGTPTATAAQATYTVTASNASGSTTTSIQITVNPAVSAPSALVYPQATVSATVGQAIAPNIPSFTGAVISFSVSPALPAGLSLNTSNGVISGTPTVQAAQASYTVTASNAGGSTTATISIVVKAYVTALDLGHGSGVWFMRSTADRVFSQDVSGHWALWDSGSDSQMASGDQYFPTINGNRLDWPVDMAGTTVAIGQTNGLEVRSTVDGHVISLIAAPTMIDPLVISGRTWWKLASDGSYICAGSSTGLVAWSPAGQQVLSRPGDYSFATPFAAPGQIQIAGGPAGQNVIETVNVGSGSSSVGPPFSGSFHSWFIDGQRYLTYTGTTVWIYSLAGVQEGLVSLPTIDNLQGQGNWISTFQNSGRLPPPYTLDIYAIGASAPTASYTATSPLDVVTPSGSMLAFFSYGLGSGSIIDLSGSTPVKTDFTTPFSGLSAFTATSAAKWFTANDDGVVIDGASTNVSRALSLGKAWSIAGGTTRVAIATASGSIFYLNPATPTSISSIASSSSKIEMSTDDSVLAAMDAQPGHTLKIFSLPSGTMTGSFPYSFPKPPNLIDFSLAGSGSVLGQALAGNIGSTFGYIRTVGPTAGGTAIWSDTSTSTYWEPIRLSPDGTLIAVSSGPSAGGTTTNIYKNGMLVTAVPGWAVGWLDNDRFLVNSYVLVHGALPYAGAVIYDATGTQLATSALPELSRLQPVGSDQIYAPALNTIFSLSSGQPVWTAISPSTDGAVAGTYVVFASGNRILLDTH
jgi:hypothetical protein